MPLLKKALAGAGDVEEAADFLGVVAALEAGRENHHIHRMRRTTPSRVSSTRRVSMPFLAGIEDPVGDFGHLAADEMHALDEQALVELLEALAGRPHVDVEVEDLGAGVLLEEVGQLEGIHAADARAPAVGVLVARTHAVDDADALRYGLAVAQNHFAGGGAAGVDQPLDFERGVDVGVVAVAIVRNALGVEGLEAGGQDDGATWISSSLSSS